MAKNTAKSMPIQAPADYTPVRISSTAERPQADRIPLFYIDDREYTIPGEIRANIAIRYLNLLRKGSQDKALADVLGALLGGEAMDALAECDALEIDDMKTLMGVIEQMLLGVMEAIQGN